MPFAASTHPKPSVAAAVTVQPEPHETSFWPVILEHCPLAHCALLVQ